MVQESTSFNAIILNNKILQAKQETFLQLDSCGPLCTIHNCFHDITKDENKLNITENDSVKISSMIKNCNTSHRTSTSTQWHFAFRAMLS